MNQIQGNRESRRESFIFAVGFLVIAIGTALTSVYSFKSLPGFTRWLLGLPLACIAVVCAIIFVMFITEAMVCDELEHEVR